MTPELYGLIEIGSVDRLESILHDFSELVENIFKTNSERLTYQMGWKSLFTDFYKKYAKRRQDFIYQLLEVDITSVQNLRQKYEELDYI